MKTGKRRLILLTAVFLLIPLSTGSFAQKITDAEIEIREGQGPTWPVDPEEPDKPGPGDPESGSLVIVKVTPFDFGQIYIAGGTAFYPPADPLPNIQVADLRGSGEGWWVNAEMSEFTDGDTTTLSGARIHLRRGRPNSEASLLLAPKQDDKLVLNPGGAEINVLTADPGTGMGLWIMRWYAENPASEGHYVELELPAGVASPGFHSATITWTLGSTP